MSLLLIPLAAFVALQIFAAISDASSMIISNKLCLAVMVTFAVATPMAWESWAVFGEHMLVGLIFFIVGFVMFAVGGLGGGDAKLMAATALWWTFPDAVAYIFYVTLFGGLLAVCLMLGKQFVPVRLATASLLSKMFSEDKKMPYGIALAAGALVTLPTSAIVARSFGF